MNNTNEKSFENTIENSLENGDEAKQAITEIISLKNELGEDYLEKEKAKQKDLSKEIIIGIENRKQGQSCNQ